MERKTRVLLAEDDSVQREVLQELLELEGYQVVATGSSTELIDHLADRPDAILLDVVGVTSAEVRTALGTLHPRPAVLIVSGQPRLPDVVRWLGADGSVAKPFDVDDLLGALEGALRSRKAAGSSFRPQEAVV